MPKLGLACGCNGYWGILLRFQAVWGVCKALLRNMEGGFYQNVVSLVISCELLVISC